MSVMCAKELQKKWKNEETVRFFLYGKYLGLILYSNNDSVPICASRSSSESNSRERDLTLTEQSRD